MTKQVVFLTANHIGLPDTGRVLHNFIEIYLFGNANMTVFHSGFIWRRDKSNKDVGIK